MYAQIEKSKENKSRAVANSVAQQKSNGKQDFGFVDNRSIATLQRMPVIQRKWDHLFNDIPKTLANVPTSFQRPALQAIIQKLIALRDKVENGEDNVHEGEDSNATDFGLMANSFLTAVEMYGHGNIDERGLREATVELWKNSVDHDVARSKGGRKKDVAAWNSLEKETWEALARHF